MTSSESGGEGVFSQTYAEARGKFIAAAEAAGLQLQSHPHPLLGQHGETLAMDIARLGAADSPRLLVITSACHGVEGFCGSGLQNALIADPGFHAAAHAAGIAVLYVHALNPWGFSWWRRTTHENVDLNRNWHDFSRPLPHNAGYEEIAHALLPASWPPAAENEAVLAAFAARHGPRALQAAVTGGQYQFDQGIFFGGRSPTWSQQTLRSVLQEHGTQCSRLAWIDIHTGLGPSGHAELIYAGRDDAASVSRARAWWGAEVTSIYDGSSASALLSGLIFNAVYEECPRAEYTGIAFEVGTVPMQEVIGALRQDQWYENNPAAPAADRAAARQRMRDTFYTDTPHWKQQVLAQGLDVAGAALRGLAGA